MGRQSEQSGSADKRRYPRIRTETRIQWRHVDVSQETREYLVGLADDYSFGGVFLITEEPLEKGEVIEMSISVPDGRPVTARAVVRWIRRFRKPAGAGLEFVEFNGIHDRDFHALIETIFDT